MNKERTGFSKVIAAKAARVRINELNEKYMRDCKIAPPQLRLCNHRNNDHQLTVIVVEENKDFPQYSICKCVICGYHNTLEYFDAYHNHTDARIASDKKAFEAWNK